MRLDLSGIIEMPGACVPFEFYLGVSDLDFPSVKAYIFPPAVTGKVCNTAGALTLNCSVNAAMICICDRCLREFQTERVFKFDIALADQLQDEENPDVVLIEGDGLDLQELLVSFIVLEMDAKFLCSESCAGLCESCGANLNTSHCSCGVRTDPRLAVLEQLLENKE